MNFELQKLTVDDNKHQFIIWADPQVRNASESAVNGNGAGWPKPFVA